VHTGIEAITCTSESEALSYGRFIPLRLTTLMSTLMSDLVYDGVPLVPQEHRSLIARWRHRSRAAVKRRPKVVPRDDSAVRMLDAAFEALPEGSREEVRARLMQVIVTFERTSDLAPVVDFIRSVMVTSRLYSNPEYRSALEAAESEPWDGPGVDVKTMIEAANERRRAARGQVG
jgi:hypothetical protein